MPEWLQDVETSGLDLTLIEIVARLSAAAIAGLAVAIISHISHGHRKSDAGMLFSTLVLLSVLIAMVTLVIGNSVARAFGLVGALSIVRFRTVVDDTRDTAFVIFSVIVGMAVGAGVWLVPFVGIPIVGAVAVGLGRNGMGSPAKSFTHQLVIRLGLGISPSTVESLLDRYSSNRTIVSTTTARQGAAFDITYLITLVGSDSQIPMIVAELNRIEGVQGVELNRK